MPVEQKDVLLWRAPGLASFSTFGKGRFALLALLVTLTRLLHASSTSASGAAEGGLLCLLYWYKST